VDELEGLLARGRGAGYAAALERGRSAVDAVLRCVAEDPRWDRQIESRYHYYAGLLIALGSCPIQPILEVLARHERENVWLAHDVLLQLAWRGHLGALAAVIHRVRIGLVDARDLENIGGRALVERVFPLAGRSPPPPEPPAATRPRPQLAPSLDVTHLLALVTGPDNPNKVMAARRLGTLDDAALMPTAKAFLLAQTELPPEHRPRHAQQRRAWCVYLESLPATRTLELAREWFHSDWPLSVVAESILSHHAEPEDRAMLEAAGHTALAEGKNYRLCSVVDALDHLADPRSLPLLGTIYCQATYSWARQRVCIALLAHRDLADAQALLVESLWDCEDYTRELACEGVDPIAAATRLRELEDDGFEAHQVREVARAALLTGQ
jgi:hypothetical protein